jgi:hypothetical protein
MSEILPVGYRWAEKAVGLFEKDGFLRELAPTAEELTYRVGRGMKVLPLTVDHVVTCVYWDYFMGCMVNGTARTIRYNYAPLIDKGSEGTYLP